MVLEWTTEIIEVEETATRGVTALSGVVIGIHGHEAPIESPDEQCLILSTDLEVNTASAGAVAGTATETGILLEMLSLALEILALET